MLVIYTGVAAHITAASVGGPRYDASLTREQRSSIDNGIHLCATCATRIDKNNGLDFPVEDLREWKAQHEADIRSQHGTGLNSNDLRALEAAYRAETNRAISKDIVMLIRQTEHALAFLSETASIETPEGSIHVARPCTDAIVAAATDGPLLIVGEPGAGKSGAIYDAIKNLQDSGFSIVLLSADKLAASSLGTLRDELGLAMPIQDALSHWPSDQPGLLVIDALDAAKSAETADTLRDLIKDTLRAGTRWHILASIRKFDLRYSLDTQKQFGGVPVDGFAEPEFSTTHHLNVPMLSEAELDDLSSQASTIGTVINTVSPELKQLLRLPFNVRLLAEIVYAGGQDELGPILTQIGLLDLYWRTRVLRGDRKDDARETVLRAIVDDMLSSRSMQANRASVAKMPGASEPLHDILSAHVVQEWLPANQATAEREILVFSHHILFDYTVARLLLRGKVNRFLQQLIDHPAYAISIRASIHLHLQHEWTRDATRARFWEIALAMVEQAGVPAIARIMPAVISAELAARSEDFAPLLALLGPTPLNPIGLTILSYLCGAFVSGQRGLVGAGTPPCCELLDQVTALGHQRIAFTVVPLVFAIMEHDNTLAGAELDALGRASRRLLELGWEGAA